MNAQWIESNVQETSSSCAGEKRTREQMIFSEKHDMIPEIKGSSLVVLDSHKRWTSAAPMANPATSTRA